MGLYSRLGFGVPTILILLILSVGSYATSGLLRWILAGLGCIVLLYAVVSFARWNWPGWHSIHHRAMLAFAMFAGAEGAAAAREGREYDLSNSCGHLASALGVSLLATARIQGACKRTTGAGHLLTEIVGDEFSVLPDVPQDKRQELVDSIENTKAGPHLVIAVAINDRFGPREAAKYVVALLKGDAK